LKRLFEEHVFDWRIAWLKGKLMLARGNAKEAHGYFDATRG
jgi:hypothetical protein